MPVVSGRANKRMGGGTKDGRTGNVNLGVARGMTVVRPTPKGDRGWVDGIAQTKVAKGECAKEGRAESTFARTNIDWPLPKRLA